MDNTITKLEPDKDNGGVSEESSSPEDDNMVAGSGADDDFAVDRMENGGIAHNEKTPASDPETPDWEEDPENPYNWPTAKKWQQVAMCASFGFLA